MNNFAELAGGASAQFLLRWRGRQNGPHSVSVIEAKLAANEIGLLHEVFYNGKWVTIRDYVAEREAVLLAEHQARDEQKRRALEETERNARAWEEQQRAATIEEERRKNALLAGALEREGNPSHTLANAQTQLKPHRGGLILTLGLIGLCVFGPLALAAWGMGNGDLREMDAGIMDESGRSSTSSGRNIGMLGTVLWILGFALILFAR